MLTLKVCTIEDCSGRAYARGWCELHYKRAKRHGGDPLGGGPVQAPRTRAVDWPDGTRSCNTCARRLPLTDFHRDSKGALGRKSRCGACAIAAKTNWYRKNHSEQLDRDRDRRERDIDRRRAEDRARYYRDRDRLRLEANHREDRRRAERAGVEFDPTVTRSALRERLGDCCAYCGREMSFEVCEGNAYEPTKATLDHKVPLSRGGPHTWENCVLACWECNGRKRLKTPDEWLRQLDAAEDLDSLRV